MKKLPFPARTKPAAGLVRMDDVPLARRPQLPPTLAGPREIPAVPGVFGRWDPMLKTPGETGERWEGIGLKGRNRNPGGKRRLPFVKEPVRTGLAYA